MSEQIAINVELLGKLSSVDIRHDKSVHGEICEKYHLHEDLIECYHLGDLLPKDLILYDSAITGDSNDIRVILDRELELYVKSSKYVKLYYGDDERSSKILFDFLVHNDKYEPDAPAIMLELMNMIAEYYEPSEPDSDSDGEYPEVEEIHVMKELLFKFVRYNQCECISIISQYISVDTIKDGKTPLMVSIDKKYETFMTILDLGADIDFGNPITKVAQKGKLDMVKELIKRGAKNNVRLALENAIVNGHVDVAEELANSCGDYQRFLTIAANKGCVRTVKILLDLGADINGGLDYESRPLISAIINKKEDVITELIRMGAGMDNDESPDRDAMYYAAKSGIEYVVTLLLENGAELKDSAIIVAAENGHRALVDKFISTRQNENDGQILNLMIRCELFDEAIRMIKDEDDVNIKQDNKTSLYLAIEKYYCKEKSNVLNLIDLILSRTNNINDKCGKNGKTALMLAAKTDLVIVDRLVKAGADLEVEDNNGKNALAYAMQNEYLNIVEPLLKAGAKPTETSVLLAVEGGKVATLIYLLGYGANISGIEGTDSPLHVACRKGSNVMVQTLLEAGADPNLPGNDGNNCLLLALNYNTTHYCLENIVENLVKFGAKVNITNVEGKSPVRVAIKSCRDEVSLLLLENGAGINETGQNGDSILLDAIEKGKYKTAEKLLDMGANPNVKNSVGKTPILLSIEYEQEELYKKLVSVGADVDINGELLHISVRRGLEYVTQDLIDRGADINMVIDGDTPLTKTIKSSYAGSQVFSVLKYNPDVDFINGDGKNALMYVLERYWSTDIALDIIERSKCPYVGETRINDWRVLEKLVFLGSVSVDTKIDGETLLMKMAKEGNLESVIKLLEMGASATKKCPNGINAITCALACGDIEIFEKLVKSIRS